MFKKLSNRIWRVRHGIDTPYEFCLLVINKIIKCTGIDLELYSRAHNRRMMKKLQQFKTNNGFKIKDAKIPTLPDGYNNKFEKAIFWETFFSYAFFDDKYDEETFYFCSLFDPECLYSLVNDKVNVKVEPGDIVIDAGAWVGDFSAYASAVGAGKTYAFEAAPDTFKILQETAKLNANIIPVNMGIAAKQSEMILFKSTYSTGAHSLLDKSENADFIKDEQPIKTISIDDFVRENNLTRVDFIKADIEGFERHLLEGAQETLKKFAPKLALCTYHLPDDPEVMAALIKKANPNYKIVQKRCKLFASI